MDTSSMTPDLIRLYLERLEAAYTRSGLTEGEKAAGQRVAHLERIRAAHALLRAADDLLREAVADARAVEHGGWVLEVGAGYGYSHTAVARLRKKGDRSPARYTWDVIGWALGVSKQAAAQRFSSR